MYNETSKYKCTIIRVDRLNNSVNGNPRYRLFNKFGKNFITASDHSFVFQLLNPGEPVRESLDNETEICLHFSKGGRVAEVTFDGQRKY